jgi:hypothetical protein
MDLDRVFDHHPPTSPKVGAMHDEVRRRFKDLASFIDDLPFEPREKAIVLRYLDDGCQAANAAVAREQVEYGGELDE